MKPRWAEAHTWSTIAFNYNGRGPRLRTFCVDATELSGPNGVGAPGGRPGRRAAPPSSSLDAKEH